MSVEVTVGPAARADYAALPTDALRMESLRYLARLKTSPFLGLRLTDHPTLGDLSDCRKIYLDEQHDVSPRYRIVYQLQPDEMNPRVADIVCIGRRVNAEVYLESLSRLGRRG